MRVMDAGAGKGEDTETGEEEGTARAMGAVDVWTGSTEVVGAGLSVFSVSWCALSATRLGSLGERGIW